MGPCGPDLLHENEDDDLDIESLTKNEKTFKEACVSPLGLVEQVERKSPSTSPSLQERKNYASEGKHGPEELFVVERMGRTLPSPGSGPPRRLHRGKVQASSPDGRLGCFFFTARPPTPTDDPLVAQGRRLPTQPQRKEPERVLRGLPSPWTPSSRSTDPVQRNPSPAAFHRSPILLRYTTRYDASIISSQPASTLLFPARLGLRQQQDTQLSHDGVSLSRTVDCSRCRPNVIGHQRRPGCP